MILNTLESKKFINNFRNYICLCEYHKKIIIDEVIKLISNDIENLNNIIFVARSQSLITIPIKQNSLIGIIFIKLIHLVSDFKINTDRCISSNINLIELAHSIYSAYKFSYVANLKNKSKFFSIQVPTYTLSLLEPNFIFNSKYFYSIPHGGGTDILKVNVGQLFEIQRINTNINFFKIVRGKISIDHNLLKTYILKDASYEVNGDILFLMDGDVGFKCQELDIYKSQKLTKYLNWVGGSIHEIKIKLHPFDNYDFKGKNLLDKTLSSIPFFKIPFRLLLIEGIAQTSILYCIANDFPFLIVRASINISNLNQAGLIFMELLDDYGLLIDESNQLNNLNFFVIRDRVAALKRRILVPEAFYDINPIKSYFHSEVFLSNKFLRDSENEILVIDSYNSPLLKVDAQPKNFFIKILKFLIPINFRDFLVGRFFIGVINDYINANKNFKSISQICVLELGAGDGWLKRLILNKFPNIKYFSVDAREEADHLFDSDRLGGAVELLSDFASTHNKRFDLVISSDFLEHITNANLARLYPLVRQVLLDSGVFANFSPSKIFKSSDCTRGTAYKNFSSLGFHITEMDPVFLTKFSLYFGFSHPEFPLFGFCGRASIFFTKFWVAFYRLFPRLKFNHFSYLLGCNFFLIRKE